MINEANPSNKEDILKQILDLEKQLEKTDAESDKDLLYKELHQLRKKLVDIHF